MDGGITMGGVLLTEADLRVWRERKAELTATINAAHDELIQVTKRIELAEELLALMNGRPKQPDAIASEPVIVADDEGESQPGAVLIRAAVEAAFNGSTGTKKTPAIRHQVRRDEKVRTLLDANPNQFYSVLYRMVRSGKLRKTPGGYRLPLPVVLGNGAGSLPDPAPRPSDPSAEIAPRA